LDRLIAIRSAEGKSVEALTKQKIQGSMDYQKELQKEMEANIAALELACMDGGHKNCPWEAVSRRFTARY
jgi:hypothetical protein